MKNIIFISGLGVPKFLAKSSLVWNDPFWTGYRRIYLSSKIPTSDQMVKFHLKELISFVNVFPEVTVMGQSLGAWWVANMACEPSCKMKKMVLTIPLADTREYPIFNASAQYYPINRIPNPEHKGTTKALVVSAENDLIVPVDVHARKLKNHFQAVPYQLDGGHFLQRDHQSSLKFIRQWMELI